jgi:hypothetical protein
LARQESLAVTCNVGLAAAAALFRLAPQQTRQLGLDILLSSDKQVPHLFPQAYKGWDDALQSTSRAHLPDAHMQFLYEAAVRTLVLHTPRDVYPGPYTYKRFWFRDAAFIVHALLCANMIEQARTVLDAFPARQKPTGFFHSQDGEWDANGEALWIFQRFCAVTGAVPAQAWRHAILKGARWLQKKRTTADTDSLHAGLLPAGFSAEHLGNNDYYYWDDFWGVAGLQAAAALCASWGDATAAQVFHTEAAHFLHAIERSLQRSVSIRCHPGIPASPYRRMDAGAIGSLVVSYPLRLWPAAETRLLHTVTFLRQRCFVRGVFFQDMFHSGLNVYLTLHIAQVLLRAGRGDFFALVKAAAALASPTGQWPEAIHPRTGGGCMGDGQHVWAAAEWVSMVRHMFVREEDNGLVLASGVVREWLGSPQPLRFGPTPTAYGDICIHIAASTEQITVTWEAVWRQTPPLITVALPDCQPVFIHDAETSSVVIARQNTPT